MHYILFTLAFVILYLVYKRLPQKQFFLGWQTRSADQKRWMTEYISSNDLVLAAALSLSSLATLSLLSIFASASATFLFMLTIFGICFRYGPRVAKKIKHNRHVFSISSAVLVATLASLPLCLIFQIPIVACSILFSYFALVEGCSRITCVGYRCCHGKQISFYKSSLLRSILSKIHHSESGYIQKDSYRIKYSQVKTVPVQAVAATTYFVAAFVGITLFFYGCYALAMFLTATIHYVSRIILEVFRDHNQSERFTTFQWMSVLNLGVCYVLTGMVSLFGNGITLQATDNSLGLLFAILQFIFVLSLLKKREQ